MTMYVVIEPKPEGKFTASLLGFPGLAVQAASESEAIALLRRSVANQLQHARIVPIDLDLPQTPNPWLQLGDNLQGNPLLDEIANAVLQYRKQLDAPTEAA